MCLKRLLTEIQFPLFNLQITHSYSRMQAWNQTLENLKIYCSNVGRIHAFKGLTIVTNKLFYAQEFKRVVLN